MSRLLKHIELHPAAWLSFCKEYGNLMPCKAFLATFERLPLAKTPAAAVATIAVPYIVVSPIAVAGAVAAAVC